MQAHNTCMYSIHTCIYTHATTRQYILYMCIHAQTQCVHTGIYVYISKPNHTYTNNNTLKYCASHCKDVHARPLGKVGYMTLSWYTMFCCSLRCNLTITPIGLAPFWWLHTMQWNFRKWYSSKIGYMPQFYSHQCTCVTQVCCQV